jgi:hypothetical protein
MTYQPTYPDWQHDFQPGPYAPTRHREDMPCYSRSASGDIFPSHFVDLIAIGQVAQSIGSTTKLYGISQAETRTTPYRPLLTGIDLRAAVDGEDVFVFGPYAADVLLTYGGTVAINDRLTSDANGRGVKAKTNQFAIAVAQESGSAGDVKKVTVITPQRMR